MKSGSSSTKGFESVNRGSSVKKLFDLSANNFPPICPAANITGHSYCNHKTSKSKMKEAALMRRVACFGEQIHECEGSSDAISLHRGSQHHTTGFMESGL